MSNYDDKQRLNPSTKTSDIYSAGQQEDAEKISSVRGSIKAQNKEHINMGYFLSLMFTVYLGAVQFGILISSWNVQFKAFAYLNNLEPDISKSTESSNKNLIVQCVMIIGCACGALFGGKLVSIGRWKCLILSNILVIASSVAQLLYTNYPVFCIAKFFYGLAIGGFSVFSNQYVSEIAPTEISGPAGSLFQVMVVVGGLIPCGIGQIALDGTDKNLEKEVLWSLILSPVVIGVIQTLLLLCAFRLDTPEYYKSKGDTQKMREVLSKIYKPYYVQNKMDEIQGGSPDDELRNPDQDDVATYGDVCCSPKMRRATYIGVFMAVLQQLTGVNIIYFYSNQILKNSGLDAGTATLLVQGFSLLGVLMGIVITGYLGRKTIMFWSSLIMSAFLIGTGISLQSTGKSVIPLLLVIGFVTVFQASSGPVTWLYMAEIMQEKGLSIGTVINWLFTLLFSFVTPLVVNFGGLPYVGYLFIICGGATVGASVFIICFMKESRGKSLAERKNLYAVEI